MSQLLAGRESGLSPVYATAAVLCWLFNVAIALHHDRWCRRRFPNGGGKSEGPAALVEAKLACGANMTPPCDRELHP